MKLEKDTQLYLLLYEDSGTYKQNSYLFLYREADSSMLRAAKVENSVENSEEELKNSNTKIDEVANITVSCDMIC